MLLTAPQHKVMGAHAAADHAEHSAIRARRVAVVGIVVALFAAIGAGAFYYIANSSAERLNKAIAELGRAQSATAAESISQEVRDRVLQAAYLVILRNATGARMADGTASPVAADTLETNAHIVELFEKLEPGEKMLVRSPGENGRDYEVSQPRNIPAFRPTPSSCCRIPLYVTEAGRWLNEGSIGVMPYDVGILKVAPDFQTKSDPRDREAGGARQHQGRLSASARGLSGRERDGLRGAADQGHAESFRWYGHGDHRHVHDARRSFLPAAGASQSPDHRRLERQPGAGS